MPEMLFQTQDSRRQIDRFLANCRLVLGVLGVLLFVCPRSGSASVITINLELRNDQGEIFLTLSNAGKDPASGVCLSLETSEETYGTCLTDDVLPGKKASFNVRVPPPMLPGTYIYAVRASYLNEGQRFGIVHAEPVWYQKKGILDVPCRIPQFEFRIGTSMKLKKPLSSGTVISRILVPEHIEVEKQGEDARWASFFLRNRNTQFRSEGSAFAVFETVSNGMHRAALCTSQVRTVADVQLKSWYPSRLVAAIGFFSLFLSVFLYSGAHNPSPGRVAGIRSAFSLAVCSLLYLGYRHAGMIPDSLLPWFRWGEQAGYLPSAAPRPFTLLFSRLYFSGGDFEPFFRLNADLLYSYMLLGNFFVLRWIIRPAPETDKYWHLLQRCFLSKPVRPILRLLIGSDKSIPAPAVSTNLCRVAVLAYLVKIFFLPMMWSWTSNNIDHLGSFLDVQKWTFITASAAVIDVLIFIDVIVFSAGYAIEMPQLKNSIRSVEPTLFGWLVCLLCYPPFNLIFFSAFNVKLAHSWPAWGAGTQNCVHGVLVVLWLIYTWATVALGMKSSNLTNRGVVASGPYRYIRHPAYAAKVSVWALTLVFLGEGFGLNVFAALIVYTLRAVTEERHLEADPEYRDYQSRVRWMFIPGVI